MKTQKKLICIMVDTGLMRKNEFKYTYKLFKHTHKLNVKLINASNIFLKKLKNISNPEKKRKFLRVMHRERGEQRGTERERERSTGLEHHLEQLLSHQSQNRRNPRICYQRRKKYHAGHKR